MDEGLIYTYPAKGSKKEGDIVPWCVRSVLINGGEVYVYKDEEYFDAKVASELRFV